MSGVCNVEAASWRVAMLATCVPRYKPKINYSRTSREVYCQREIVGKQ